MHSNRKCYARIQREEAKEEIFESVDLVCCNSMDSKLAMKFIIQNVECDAAVNERKKKQVHAHFT